MDLMIILTLLAAVSLAMGSFSVSQLGYQDRGSSLEMIPKSIVAFLKGFFLWPYFFPIGLKNGKYQMKVFHKIGNGKLRP